MAQCSNFSPSEFPSELVATITQHAVCDADSVGLFITELFGIVGREKGLARVQLRFPAWFLLELAAVLRLLAWEQDGVLMGLVARFPPWREALSHVFARLAASTRKSTERGDTPILLGVIGLLVEHFAWTGQADLGAEFILGEAEEDDLVNAVAEFVWAHRHPAIEN
jgi:hypothetical protein